MSETPTFTITYWGVTGTFCDPLLPRQVTDKLVNAIYQLAEKGRLAELRPGAASKDTIRSLLEEELPFPLRSSYGGNTTCVEVRTPDATLILDCGSGFRELGYSLDSRWQSKGDAARRNAHVLLTHSHIDHTFATPYFSPYYDPRNSFTIWGPQVALDSLAAVLDPKSILSQVYFPPTYSEMKGLAGFRRLEPGNEIQLGATRITTFALNHPGGSMAYRFECNGRVFVFATDHEHQETPDRALAAFAREADLLYTEGQYTAAEHAGEVGVADDRPFSRRGWGHSPVESCIATALEAGVRQLHVGHRDPLRNDYQIAEFEAYAREVVERELHRLRRPAGACTALVPYEGLTVTV